MGTFPYIAAAPKHSRDPKLNFSFSYFLFLKLSHRFALWLGYNQGRCFQILIEKLAVVGHALRENILCVGCTWLFGKGKYLSCLHPSTERCIYIRYLYVLERTVVSLMSIHQWIRAFVLSGETVSMWRIWILMQFTLKM